MMQTQTTYDPHREYNEKIAAEMAEHFGTESRLLDRAAATFQTGKQALLRPDGQPRYAEAEMQERRAALLAAFDREAEWVTTQAEEAIPAAQAELAKIEGFDPFDSLKPEQQQHVAARREIVKEDCELKPAGELVAKAKAALAAGDRPLLYLLDRYIGMRLDRDAGRRDPALSAAHREIVDALADPKAVEKREKARRKLEIAKLLNGRVDMARRQLDGRHDAMLAGMRQRYALG